MNRHALALLLSLPGALALCVVSLADARSDADSDYRARAGHKDVVRAIRFDSRKDVDRHVQTNGRFAAAGGGWDTKTKASGRGSLHFVTPSNSHAGTAGSWRINFSEPPFDVQFGPNEEFFVQWRQRFDDTYVNTRFKAKGGRGWKQVIIGEGDRPNSKPARSCSELEIVIGNTSQRGMPQMYHSCGKAKPWQERYGKNDFKLQNAIGPPFCLYSKVRNSSERPPPPCVGYKANQWMTFQVRVKLGPRGVGHSVIHGPDVTGFVDSHVQMWVAYEGEPSTLIHDWSGLVLQETANRRYGKVWLLPYLTKKDPTHAHPPAHTWYDELIVSRSRIADPKPARQIPTRTNNGARGTGR